MAIEVPLMHESGAFARYHRLLEVRFDFHNHILELHVQSFLDEAAARSSKVALGTEVVRIKLDVLREDPRRWMYELITQLPTSPFIDSPADVALAPAQLCVPELRAEVKVRPPLPSMPPAPLPTSPPAAIPSEND